MSAPAVRSESLWSASLVGNKLDAAPAARRPLSAEGVEAAPVRTSTPYVSGSGAQPPGRRADGVRVEDVMPLVQDPGDELDIDVVVARIVQLNAGLAAFWKESHGWAPVAAAELLGKSRRDRQVSLSTSILRFAGCHQQMTDGDLILAWANLGALLEGTMKTFLSVYHQDYEKDVGEPSGIKAYQAKDGSVKQPDVLTLEMLRTFFQKKDLFAPGEADLAKLIQDRRNAIHAFKDRTIGTSTEFRAALRGYLRLLRRVAAGLPYPDTPYRPTET